MCWLLISAKGTALLVAASNLNHGLRDGPARRVDVSPDEGVTRLDPRSWRRLGRYATIGGCLGRGRYPLLGARCARRSSRCRRTGGHRCGTSTPRFVLAVIYHLVNGPPIECATSWGRGLSCSC